MKHLKKIGCLLLVLCMVMPLLAFAEASQFTAGVYTATGMGMNGDVAVTVTFSGDAITAITVGDHQETAGISDPAISKIPDNILAQQSTAIDVISGATLTSNALIEAVNDTIRQAGVDPSTLMPQDIGDKSEETVTLQADVVVLGGGLTGLSAAIRASQEGASVILLEKQAALGGSSGISGGQLSASQTKVQAAAGVTDTNDAWYEEWLHEQSLSINQGLYPDTAKVRTLIERSSATIDWMSEMGYEFGELSGVRGHRTAGGMGAVMIQFFADKAAELGVEIYVDARANTLLQGEDGAITGVIANGGGKRYEVTAGAVVLATGGFGANADMIAAYIPQLANFASFTTTAAGNTGDGITMALAVGAQMYEDPWVINSYLLPVTSELNMLVYIGHQKYIYVDQNGDRFIGEDAHFPFVYNAAVQSSEKKYLVFDSGEDFAEHKAIIEGLLETEGVYKAETTAELAELIGAANLDATITTYNAGGDTFGKSAEQMVKLDSGPYYAIKCNPYQMGTMGGVKVDDVGAVLDAEGKVIAGLYAGGEMANRPYYAQVYMGGSATQIAATTGKIAGEAAAAYVKEAK